MKLNEIILEQKFDEIIDMLNRVVCFTSNEREAKARVINMTKELKKEFISNFNVSNVTEKFSVRDLMLHDLIMFKPNQETLDSIQPFWEIGDSVMIEGEE